MTTNSPHPCDNPWQAKLNKEEEVDIDLNDPGVQKAAAMIQGKFKFKLKKTSTPKQVGQGQIAHRNAFRSNVKVTLSVPSWRSAMQWMKVNA